MLHSILANPARNSGNGKVERITRCFYSEENETVNKLHVTPFSLLYQSCTFFRNPSPPPSYNR